MANKKLIFCKRKFLATALAAIVAISISITASAMGVESTAENSAQTSIGEVKETVWVGGYECWEENGNYYTMIDSEAVLVIDCTDTSKLSKCVSVTESSIGSSTAMYAGVRYEENLSDGHEYAGRIDISNGDCSTPIFYVSRKSQYRHFLFKTGFVLPEKYSITVWVDYADDLGYGMTGWNTRSYVITFNAFYQSHQSFVLAYSDDFGGICKFVFHKEGSDGDSRFNYWVSPEN